MKQNLQKVLPVFFLALCLSTHTQSQTITTFAGNGTPGYLGDDGQATVAELSGPSGVAIDDSGNIYISDEFNNCIRKVNLAGIITTVAGKGAVGYSGDNGPATAAELDDPTGVAVDAAGNIYIADNQNNRVRKVTAGTGIITTIAGTGKSGFSGDNGAATAAQINSPFDVATDILGNIYLSDRSNNCIRKISGGTITTVAGIGSTLGGYTGDGGKATAAELNGPEGIALDDSGNIYIADYSNNVIRKTTASTGIITTFAGTGLGQYSGDGGAATAADINNPAGIGLDTKGNIYISDYGDYRIRKVSGGIITTIAGDGSGGYSGDGGPATAAELYNPNGLVLDTAGNVYVADFGNERIREITGCASLVVLPKSPTICSGQSITLTVSGGTNYTWSPNGSNILSGDSVVVTPSSTITYTVSSTGGCGSTGQVIVTVIPAPNKPTITVSVTGDSLISSAGQDNQWYYNDTLLTDSTNQVIVIKGRPKGWYTVSVINQANGCSSLSDSTTSIADLALRNDIQIFPNPFSNDFIVQIHSSGTALNDWSIQLNDAIGRLVYSKESLNYTNPIDLQNLTDGVYFITIANKNGRAIFPIVKQN